MAIKCDTGLIFGVTLWICFSFLDNLSVTRPHGQPNNKGKSLHVNAWPTMLSILSIFAYWRNTEAINEAQLNYWWNHTTWIQQNLSNLNWSHYYVLFWPLAQCLVNFNLLRRVFFVFDSWFFFSTSMDNHSAANQFLQLLPTHHPYSNQLEVQLYSF